MHKWDVSIRAARQAKKLNFKRWIEHVSSIDMVSARATAKLQAARAKPCYDIYQTGTIIKAKT